MKKILTIALITFFITANAQFNKRYATLTLKNGTELKGYAKISGFNIRFSKERRGKEKKYNHKDVDLLKIKLNHNYKTLKYVLEKGKKTPLLLEIVLQGKVNLYLKPLDYNYFPTVGGGGMTNTIYNSVPKYFLQRDGEKTAIRFKNKFNKLAKEYFKDCPKLTDKIGERDYRRKDTFEIVEYYNENCN